MFGELSLPGITAREDSDRLLLPELLGKGTCPMLSASEG
jgi:hypothetical protein